MDENKEAVELNKEEVMEEIKLKNESTSKPRKPRKSKISAQDVQDMSDKEIIDVADDEVQELYYQFNSFIETKTDLEEDDGIKGLIPTKIRLLNAILSGDPHNGGFAGGSLNQIAGQPGCGKSMLVMQTLGNAQLYFDRKVIVALLDSEYSTTSARLANLGVKYPRIKPYTESKTKRITVEKLFQFIEGICLYKEENNKMDIPVVIGWDSIANTLSKKELEATDPKDVIGYRGRLFSLLIPNYVAKCYKYNICILAVNQMRDRVKMNAYSPSNDLKYMTDDQTVPGGKALRFNTVHLLEMKQLTMGKKDIDKYGFEGISTEITCVKNKLFRPHIPIKMIGDFNRGFSDFWTNYIFLVDNNWIKAGSWNSLITYPTKKFRTKNEAIYLYQNDSDFKKAYDEAVDDAINEIIIKPNIVEE